MGRFMVRCVWFLPCVLGSFLGSVLSPIDKIHQLISSLDAFNAEQVERDIQEQLHLAEPEHDATPMEMWTRAGGFALLEKLNDMEHLLIWHSSLLFQLAELVIGHDSAAVEFAEESGLRTFCRDHEDVVTRSLARRDAAVGSGERYSFAGILPNVCPDMVVGIEMKTLVLRHRLNKRLPRIRADPLISLSINHMDGFELATEQLNGEPASLRWGLGDITTMDFDDGSQREERIAFNEWFEWASMQVLGECLLFEDTTGAGLFLHADGSDEGDMERLSAFGRMMALGLMHRASDSQFEHIPHVLFARMLGEEVSLESLQLTFWDIPELTSLEALSDGDLEAVNLRILIQGEWVRVTSENRQEVVRRKINESLPPRFDAAVAAIREGFLSLIPLDVIGGLLTASELQHALAGPVQSVEDPQENHLQAFFDAQSDDFHGQSPYDWWNAIGGESLLVKAVDDAEDLRTLILIATNLNVPPGKEENFAKWIGFEGFCREHKAMLRDFLVRDRRAFCALMREEAAGIPESAFEMAFAANLNLYCPFLVDSLDMKEAILAHRLLRNFSLTSDEDAAGIAPTVRRDRAFNDSVWTLLEPPTNVRMGIASATFVNEAGHGNGVAEDWLTEAISQAFGPAEGLFVTAEDSPFFLEVAHRDPSMNYEELSRYRAVGRLIAIALIEGRALGVPLPIAFLAQLTDQKLSLDDIKDDHPYVYQSLRRLEIMTGTELADAEVYIGDTLVTIDNRREIIGAAITGLQDKSAAMEAIVDAFRAVIPVELLDGLISPREFKQIIVGSPAINFDDIETHVHLNGYGPHDAELGWLFRILKSYDQNDKQLFLRFVTASPVLPVSGLGGLRLPLTVARSGADPSRTLPTASTCFNTLRLPVYSTEEFLRSNLTLAIRASAAMGEA